MPDFDCLFAQPASFGLAPARRSNSKEMDPRMTCKPHSRRLGDTPVSNLGLDDFEVVLLSVVRHFITSFAAPDTQSWTEALRIASDTFGVSEGAKAAVTLLGVVEAMRRSRRSTFQFSDPNCPTCCSVVTPNERHLMRMVHALRRGRVSEAQTDAMLLCEGAQTEAVLRAAFIFAGLFPADKSGGTGASHPARDTVAWRVH